MIKQVMPLVVGLFLCGSLMAQVPKQINYQGIARNAYGTALSNQTITLRLTIRDGSATGPVIYQESRSVTTNQFGLFSTAIGGEGATAVSGSMNAAAWNTGTTKYLQVEMDARGGNQFSSLGASPLTSVPFAFRAESAAPAGAAGGDLSGDYPNPTIKAGAVTGDKIAAGTITADKLADGVIPSSLPVSGAAGGDLTGSYPNPTIANNAVVASKIAAGAVTNAKLADNAVGTSNVQDGAITAAKLAPGVIPSSLPVSGTAGGDLTGTYPNPTIANNAITNAKLANNSVGTAQLMDASVNANKIADNAIGANKIAAGAVTNAKLAANSVNTANLVDGSITAAKLAPGVIPSSVPVSGTAGGDLSGTYPNPTIANNAITNAKLANNAVGTANVQDGAITAAKLAPGVIPSSVPVSGTAGGDLSGTYPNPTIANNAITATKLADNAVSSAKLSDNAVTTAKIANNAVTAVKIADNSISAAKISDNAVSAAKIADNAVGTTKIANNAVSVDKIAAGAVTNAKLAANAIGTSNVQDGAITAAKLAPGVIPSSLPVSGTAGGDLSGTYPNPTIANNAVTAVKIADNAVSAAKLADNAVSAAKIADNAVGTTKIANNAVSADKIAAGAVTNAKLAANAVNTANVVDGSITAAKLAPGVIPSSLPVSGTAGGDLSGTYPNPTIANNAVTTVKIADNAVSAAKLADNSVSAAKLANNAVTTAKIADNAINTTKISDNAVSATKIADNAVSAAKIADNAVGATKIADNAVSTAKIANNAVSADKIAAGAVTSAKLAASAVTTASVADGAITAAKLAPGVIPSSLPVSGTAGGDLSGTFPNPTVSALNGIPVVATTPTSGQVLKFNGTAWAPGSDDGGSGGGFELPFAGSGNSNTELFGISNTGNGVAIGATSNSNGNAVVAVSGRITSPNPDVSATGIYGEINNTGTSNGMAVLGRHRGNGTAIQGYSVGGDAVRGESESGFGIYGYSNYQNGVFARSDQGAGLYATSNNGPAARFDLDESNYSETINVYNTNGVGIDMITMNSPGLRILTFNEWASPIEVNHAGGGTAIYGETYSDYAPSVLGRNTGYFAGVHGYAPQGIGVLAETNQEGYSNGIGFKSVIGQSGGANHAVFETDGNYVARIDETGRGFFNGGTTNSGADVAELFSVEGSRASYEPGDVLEISTNGDRKMVKSSGPYSSLVAGVYATKPGVLLTEENATVGDLSTGVPMGVIGVLPTKVCLEGGPIKRGDLIVTSSIPGVAMKGDPDKVKIGQVLGKALQDYSGNGIGKINVLVSVK